MTAADWVSTGIAAVSAGTAVFAIAIANSESRKRAEGKMLTADLERRVGLLESQGQEHRNQMQEIRTESKAHSEKMALMHTSLEVLNERMANNTQAILEKIGGLQETVRLAGRNHV